ncbi:MAG: hypothetical protein V4560_03440 [Bacteroidota bacterium]
MILLIFKIILLLGVIIIPLRPQKAKIKVKSRLKVDADTKYARYAINENGSLEEIDRHIFLLKNPF